MPTEYPLGGAASGFPGQLTATRVTILNGAAGVSEIFPTQGRAIMALVIPATWVAAGISIKGGLIQNSVKETYNQAGIAEGTVAVVVQDTIVLFPSDAEFLPFLQLMSATAGSFTPVDQTADREIIVVWKQYLT